MAGAAIIDNLLNGWAGSTSTGAPPPAAFRRLITTQRALIRLSDTRM